MATSEQYAQEARAKAREMEKRESGLSQVFDEGQDTINDRLDILSHIQNDLGETLSLLRNKLRPVLDPRGASEVGYDVTPPEETNLSPVAHRLETLRINFRDDLRNLQDIINLVDL